MIQIGTLNIPEWIVTVLMITGFSCICAVVIAIGVFIRNDIADWVDYKKYEHKRKHRFDKPPLAKCYCKDCTSYGTGLYKGQCFRLGNRYFDDNWFCGDAEPRIIDPDKEDDKNV